MRAFTVIILVIMCVASPRCLAQDTSRVPAPDSEASPSLVAGPTVRALSVSLLHHQTLYNPYIPEIESPGANLLGQERSIGAEETWMLYVGFDVDLCFISYRGLCRVQWDNRAYFDASQYQPRHVGWEFDLAVPVLTGTRTGRSATATPILELLWHHHSQHVMDLQGRDYFPLRDSAGVRVNFITGESP